MIKTLVLIVTIFNPANDTEKRIAIGPYTLDECLLVESEIYLDNSPMMIEIKNNGLELVETKCD